jgi:hypothetical protein
MSKRSLETAKIGGGYSKIYVTYLGKPLVDDGRLRPGPVQVVSQGELVAEGMLQKNGILSGMARLYDVYGLRDGTAKTVEMQYRVISKSRIEVTLPNKPGKKHERARNREQSVAVVQQLRPIFMEPFRAENLATWEPQTEPDVYLAFGVLQEYTEFEYCCGASQELLNTWGYMPASNTRPDAILISRTDHSYVVAEFKIGTRDFLRSKHLRQDVDVLVVWTDDISDEQDKANLPPSVVVLQDVAKRAAAEGLLGEEVA